MTQVHTQTQTSVFSTFWFFYISTDETTTRQEKPEENKLQEEAKLDQPEETFEGARQQLTEECSSLFFSLDSEESSFLFFSLDSEECSFLFFSLDSEECSFLFFSLDSEAGCACGVVVGGVTT
jgi:hypothetical protein